MIRFVYGSVARSRQYYYCILSVWCIMLMYIQSLLLLLLLQHHQYVFNYSVNESLLVASCLFILLCTIYIYIVSYCLATKQIIIMAIINSRSNTNLYTTQNYRNNSRWLFLRIQDFSSPIQPYDCKNSFREKAIDLSIQYSYKSSMFFQIFQIVVEYHKLEKDTQFTILSRSMVKIVFVLFTSESNV